MRIAVIADIHGNSTAFSTVINHIQEQNIDKVFFLGDLVANGPNTKEVMEMMNRLSPAVWIKGNTDYWFEELGNNFEPNTERERFLYSLYQYASQRLTPEEIEYLRRRPEKQQIEVNGVSILCVHGSPYSNSEQIGIMTSSDDIVKLIDEMEADILLCGHSHIPYYAAYNGKRVINVGSISLAMDGESMASYGILDIRNDGIAYTNQKVTYDIQKTLDDAVNRGFPYIDIYIKRMSEANKVNKK